METVRLGIEAEKKNNWNKIADCIFFLLFLLISDCYLLMYKNTCKNHKTYCDSGSVVKYKNGNNCFTKSFVNLREDGVDFKMDCNNKLLFIYKLCDWIAIFMYQQLFYPDIKTLKKLYER